MIVWTRASLHLFAVGTLCSSSHQVMTSSPLFPWYLLNFAYVPSLALVCIQAIILMIVCHMFPSRVSDRFISTIGTIGTTGGDGGSGTTGFGTFLFHITSSSVLVAFSDWNLL